MAIIVNVHTIDRSKLTELCENLTILVFDIEPTLGYDGYDGNAK